MFKAFWIVWVVIFVGLAVAALKLIVGW